MIIIHTITYSLSFLAINKAYCVLNAILEHIFRPNINVLQQIESMLLIIPYYYVVKLVFVEEICPVWFVLPMANCSLGKFSIKGMVQHFFDKKFSNI